jgi:hypothetical protein
MLIQPVGHGFQLAADLVLGVRLKYTVLDGAFFSHGRLLVFWFALLFQGVVTKD